MGFLSWLSNAFSGEDAMPEEYTSPVTVDLLLQSLNAPRGFADNVIVTSKYTILTFLPLNLYEQFRRISNFFFLIVMCLSLVPGASPIDPISAIAPLAAVLLAAAIKDGYEDYKRHRADAAANATMTHVLRGRDFMQIPSRDVRVGDVMKYFHGEEIRADCVLLNSSLPDGLAYIETANLDGETNAKARKARINTVEQLGNVSELLEQCVPESMREKYYANDGLSKVFGDVLEEGLRTITMTTAKLKRMTLGDSESASATKVEEPAPGVRILGSPPGPNLAHWQGQIQIGATGTFPLGVEQFVPRGCVLRNMEWAIMAVVYTGSQTKMMLNLRTKPAKMSLMERNLNRINIVLFALNQACILVLCGLSVWWNERRTRDGMLTQLQQAGRGTWYLDYFLSRYTPVQLFFWRYITYFILMSYMIPISLYITLEINKATQVLLIASDTKISELVGGVWRYCRPKTSNLNVQLAHVRYIFTDKTGTLTENCMRYVGGYVAGGIRQDATMEPDLLGRTFLHNLSSPADDDQPEEDQHEAPTATAPTFSPMRLPSADSHRLDGLRRSASFHSDGGGSPLTRRMSSMLLSGLSVDYDDSVVEKWPVFQFLMGLSLCHNVVCFEKDEIQDNEPSLHLHHNSVRKAFPFGGTPPREFLEPRRHPRKVYEGQSLDEVALVEAGRNNLFELVHRSARQIVVEVFGAPKAYDIIAEMEFTPARKLMSIILRRSPTDDDAFARGSPAPSVSASDERSTPAGGGHPVEFETSLTEHLPNALFSPHHSRVAEPAKLFNPSGAPQSSIIVPSGLQFPETAAAVPVAATAPEHEEGNESVLLQVLFPEKPHEYIMLTKGADSSMFRVLDRTNPVNAERKTEFETVLNDYATTGLRTLVLGMRVLTAKQVDDFLVPYRQALCTMEDRDGALHRVYATVEQNLTLVGVTAVEDKLQEGVPETLDFLLRSEIVVWMLTGDKRETAVTIAGTSGLLDPQFSVVFHIDVSSMPLDDPDPQVRELQHHAASAAVGQQLQTLKHDCDRHKQMTVMVIDGVTLGIVLSHEGHTRLFFEVGSRCRSAVCCRMTPLQKAQIVRMFQENTQGIALAIGDGANDVSMIQESKIGIGIMGLEGSQAELSSDFAIPKFRHLKRLMVVHGRSSLFRDSMVILYSVYKNFILVFCLVAYCGFSGFSGVAVFDSWLLAMFNLFFCTLQPLLIGSFDKDVEDELCETHPQLYAPLEREDAYFNARTFIEWLSDGLIAGLAIFLVVLETMENDDLHGFRNASMEQHSTILFIGVVFAANVRVTGMLRSWNAVLVAGVVVTFAALPAFIFAYSSVESFGSTNWMVGVGSDVFQSTKLWLHLFFIGSAVVFFYNGARSFYYEQTHPNNNSYPAHLVAEQAMLADERGRQEQLRSTEGSIGQHQYPGRYLGTSHNDVRSPARSSER